MFSLIDRLAVAHWDQSIGLFDSFECVQDKAGSQLLLNATRDWFVQKGMQAMREPWSLASQEWGLGVGLE